MILVWLACAYPEEDFQVDYDAAWCEWEAECEDYQSEDECLQAAEDTPWEETGCDYDADMAKECVSGVEQMPCTSAEVPDPVFPTQCAAVWDCR